MEEAFNIVELSRARGFLRELLLAKTNYRFSELEYYSLYKLMDRKRVINVLLKTNIPEIKVSDDQRKNLESELEGLNNELSSLQSLLTDELILNNASSIGCTDCELSKNIPIRDLQKLLNDDTTILEYYIIDQNILIFVIQNDKFSVTNVNINDINVFNTWITNVRKSDIEITLDEREKSLENLNNVLIKPVAQGLDTDNLYIIPFGELNYIPFAALYNGDRYLIDNHKITYLPSASSLQYIINNRKELFGSNVLIFGNPITFDSLAPLPLAENEAISIGNIYTTKAFTQLEANEHYFWENAGKSRVIHIAAHGMYNSDAPLFSTMYLALDPSYKISAPIVLGNPNSRSYRDDLLKYLSEEKHQIFPGDNDGLLELYEIYNLDLRASTELVVLSGCETNRGSLGTGEEITGFTRGFLAAGSSNVVASLWKVDDWVTSELMIEFHQNLKNKIPVNEALRIAQLKIREKYPDPYLWSSFVLTGDGTNILIFEKPK